MLVSTLLVFQTVDHGADNARVLACFVTVAGITVFIGAAYLSLFISTGTFHGHVLCQPGRLLQSVLNIASHLGTAVALNHGSNHRPPGRASPRPCNHAEAAAVRTPGRRPGSHQNIVILLFHAHKIHRGPLSSGPNAGIDCPARTKRVMVALGFTVLSNIRV